LSEVGAHLPRQLQALAAFRHWFNLKDVEPEKSDDRKVLVSRGMQRSICIVVLAMLSLLLSSCSSLNLGSPFSTPLGGAGFETPAQDEYQRCIHSDYPDECDQQKKLADTYKSLGF
jgi:hypothetical protein